MTIPERKKRRRTTEARAAAKVRRRSRKVSSAPIKLADVARRARVSTATASRAINAPHKVSQKTRERVAAAVQALNWIPHGAAQALASLRTRTVGALIPNLGHQAIASMIETLQETLGESGYTLLLGGGPGWSPERAIRQATTFIQHGVECLVLMGEDQPKGLLELLHQRNVFTVVAYTSGHYGTKNCIGFDNSLEMARLTQYLLDLGHRHFALVTRSYEGNDRIRQRVEAVHRTLATAGIAIRPQHMIIVDRWQIGAGREGMAQILAATAGPRPTAVMCANDYLAAGAMIEAKAAGLVVPRDISVTGFDDLELAAQLDPPLTTIRVPAPRVGTEVARYIIDTLERGSAVLPPRLDAELMIRSSTAPPPKPA